MITGALITICALALLASFVKGVTGAASAIVFNAGLLTVLALGYGGGLTLLDGLYWIGISDMLATVLMAFALRKEIKFEPMVVILLAGMLPVTVVFALLLEKIDVGILGPILALTVIGAGIYLALRRDGHTAAMGSINRWAFPTGALAGTLAGLFGMGGPVIFLLLTRASDDPSLFRSRIVTIGAVANVVRFGVLASTGAYTAQRLEWFVISIPFVLIALAAGMWAHKRIKPRPFRLGLGVLVALAGLGALLRSFV